MITANWKHVKPADGRARNPHGGRVHKGISYRQECTYQYAPWFRLARNIARMDPTHEVCDLLRELVHLDSEVWRGHAVSVPKIEALVARLETIYHESIA